MNVNIARLHARRFLLLICLVFLADMTHAAGVREFVVSADSSGPAIAAQLWTPCAAPPESIGVGSSGARLAIKGVNDCIPTGRGLPLVLISHGMFGDMYSHHDTAEFLADAGFAVVTLNHTLDSASSISGKSADDISSFLVRPVDIKRVIDSLLNKPHPAVDIDLQRIGFFGFSRGGYTGLVLAGAVPDFHAPPFPCPEEYLMCKQIRDNDIPTHGPGYDPRIKAFVIADPLSFFPDKASLQNVNAPIQLWSSDRGEMGLRPEDVAAVAANLPKAPEFHHVPNSRHLSFLFPCTADEAKVLPPLICAEPPGFDRVEFHRTLNARVLEFFRKNLPTGNER